MNVATADSLLQLFLWSTLKVSVLLVIVLGWLNMARKTSASIRYSVVLAALIGALIMPLLSIVGPVWSLSILPSNRASPSLLSPSPINFHAQNPYYLDIPGIGGAKLEAVSNAQQPIKPANNESVVSKPISDLSNQSTTSPNQRAPEISTVGSGFLLAVWLLGVLLVLTRWYLIIYRVRMATKNGIPVDTDEWQELCHSLALALGIQRQPRLLISADVTVPLTWGMRNPVILLPPQAVDWSMDRRRIVLLHELAHIVRWDYLTQGFAMVSGACNWFNPLVWKLVAYLSIERENACDDRVLTMGTKNSDYAYNLVDIAANAKTRWATLPGVLAMGQSSQLAKRIRRILDTHQQRNPLNRRRNLCLILILALFLLPLSTLQFSRVVAQADEIPITLAVDPGTKEVFQDAKILAEFETQHPGVKIHFVDTLRLPDAADGLDTYYTALQKYASSADILFIDGFNLGLSPIATRAGYFLDMAPLINSDKSLNINDFYQPLWHSFQWDHGIWAMPFGADMVLLNYDKTAFDKAGMAYPDGKWTLKDFADAVTKLTIKDADGHVTRTGFANSGRIFRESLWRSLMTSDAVDDSVLPNIPKLDSPEIESIIDTYHSLEDQGMTGGDSASTAMYVDTVHGDSSPNRGFSLLPGNHSILLPFGFALSSGTQHPDLAYDLIKFMSTRPELTGGITLQKGTSGLPPIKSSIPPEYQDLLQKALDNALTYSNLRFTDYLNNAHFQASGQVQSALRTAETQLVDQLKTADNKKSTLTLTVSEPATHVIPPGKIALKFDVTSYIQPLPNKELWDKVIKDFTASDPQVAAVDLNVVLESASQAASRSDCFYLPSNAVQSTATDVLLPIDPFMNADPGFDKHDYFDSVLIAVQRNNKTYALPIGMEPLVLRYSGDRFNAAKLPKPTNTWKLEDFINALQALKSGGEGQAPFVDNGTNGSYLLILIADYGGLPIDYRTTPLTVNFTDPRTVTAIQQALDLAKSGSIRYTSLGSLSGGNDAFPTNTTAIYPAGLNGFGRKTAPGSSPDQNVLFPMGRQYNALSYNLGTAYISASSQNPEACYRFISTIAKHLELFSTMPVRSSLLNSSIFQSSINPDILALYNQVALLMQDAHTVSFPILDKANATLSDMLVQHWLFEAFDTYVLGGGDLEPALKTAESYAKGFLECTAGLPALNLLDARRNNTADTKSYIDCAGRIDPRLKAVLAGLG